jgi:hypothetical protein
MPFDKDGRWYPPGDKWMTPTPKPVPTVPVIPEAPQPTNRVSAILNMLKSKMSVPSAMLSPLRDVIAKQRERQIEQTAQWVQQHGGSAEAVRTPDYSRIPEVPRQFLGGLGKSLLLGQGATQQELEQIGQPTTTAGRVASIAGSIVGAMPLYMLLGPLGKAAGAQAARLPLTGATRAAAVSAASMGTIAGSAEAATQLVSALSGKQNEDALRAIGLAAGIGTVAGAGMGALGWYVPRLVAAYRTNRDLKTYRTVLGVSDKATAGDIEAAFRAKARTVHPDINPSPQAKEQFMQALQARDVLKHWPELEKLAVLYDAQGPQAVDQAIAQVATLGGRSLLPAPTAEVTPTIPKPVTAAPAPTIPKPPPMVATLTDAEARLVSIAQTKGRSLEDLESALVKAQQALVDKQVSQFWEYVKHTPGVVKRERVTLPGAVVGEDEIWLGGGSLNDSWYREFYAAHKRSPNKSELPDIARDVLLRGYTLADGTEIPPNQQFIQMEGALGAIRSAREKIAAQGGVGPGAAEVAGRTIPQPAAETPTRMVGGGAEKARHPIVGEVWGNARTGKQGTITEYTPRQFSDEGDTFRLITPEGEKIYAGYMGSPADEGWQRIEPPTVAATEETLAGEVKAAQAAEEAPGIVPPSFRAPEQAQGYAFSDPEVEARYQASHGITGPTALTKLKDFSQALYNKFTRVYENLPNTPEFAQLKNDLLKLSKQRGVASDRTVRLEQAILTDLRKDSGAYEIFERKVLLDDLAQETLAGRALPLGFTPELVASEKAKLDALAAQNPGVQAAIAKRKQAWDALKADYINAMDKIGFDVSERFGKEDYFRHQVLEYANARGVSGTGQKLKAPTSRGFLKQRKGSTYDINTDYLQAEYEVMSQMLHDIEVAKFLYALERSPQNIADQVKADARAAGEQDWHKMIPDGYTLWQAREGNIFYLANSIPERMAQKLLEGAVTSLELSAEDVRKVLAMGGPHKEFVVKEEVAATLDNLKPAFSQDPVSRLARGVMDAWKQYQLISPKRFPRYNIRNLTGDAEAVAIGNPRAFLKAPRALKELYQAFVQNGPMTPDLRDWFERGGMESTLQVAELGDIDKLEMFHGLIPKRRDIAAIPMNLFKSYWKTARLTTDVREAILRYAAYLEYLEQLQANKGVPRNWGASIPEEILAISDIKDRAYRLSNDLLGAYDEVSVAGQWIRQHLGPFWSWQEVNMRRYSRFIRNAIIDPNVAVKAANIAGLAVKKSPFVAFRVGVFVIKAAGLWGLLSAWNNTLFPEEERGLPEEVRKKPHIILGRDEDGKVIAFTRLGILSDFLSWFGIDGPPQELVRDWLNGRKSAKQVAEEMAHTWVNERFQLLGPQFKIPAELLAKRVLYPDFARGAPIRDKWEYLADTLGLGDEYKAIAGKPARPYVESLKNLVTYRYDIPQTSYYAIQDQKRQFLKKLGKEGDYSGIITPRSQALYNFKLAIRYEDKEAMKKYLLEYASLGGTANGIATSLRNMHPLFGLNQAEQAVFVQQLDEDGKQQLKNAIKFYQEVLLGVKP